jgi:hypothetical protein
MPPPPATGSPSPNGSITLTHFEENFSLFKLPYQCQKSKGKIFMVEEPWDVKHLSLNHMCKIGLS